MISEANINIKTATNEELITELLILEDYPMYKEIYKAIQIELNKRENQVINQTIKQKQQKPCRLCISMGLDCSQGCHIK